MTETVDRAYVTRRMSELFIEHGLADTGWTFKFSRTTRALGITYYTKKRIDISGATLPYMTVDEVEDTMRHEVAHAILGPGYGHGPEWKNMARRLGANPRASAKNVRIPPKWTFTCTETWCRRVYNYQGKPRLTPEEVRCHCGGRLVLQKVA